MILQDQMEDYHKIQKQEALGENDFNTCSTGNFPELHPDFGGLDNEPKILNSD